MTVTFLENEDCDTPADRSKFDSISTIHNDESKKTCTRISRIFDKSNAFPVPLGIRGKRNVARLRTSKNAPVKSR